MASEPPKETLILDSTHLFLTAVNPATPRPPSPLPPLPSDVPPSKFIPNTRFLVDAFRHAGDYSVSYFLSHFHSDHYTGLAPNWSKGIVFCSDITRRLLIEVLSVSPSFVVALPLREPILIDGAEVTLIDANHCPGAVQFLIKVPIGGGAAFERYVHTGDFRFCDSMRSEQCLGQFVGCDAVFLDTTYCNPKYVFPPQEESIDYVVRTIGRIRNELGVDEKVLFLVATYVIGKEKILLQVAERCSCKVYVDSRKMSILKILGYENSGVFTENESESSVHVVGWNVLGETWPYFRPNFVKMKEIMVERGYSKAVGFVPTGWTYELKREKFSVRTKDSFEIHLVPYSEHSNYDELREFVKLLKPKRVVPTVGSDIEKLDSDHVLRVQKHFSGLVDEMANKRDFFMNFHKVSTGNGEISGGGNENEVEKPLDEDITGNSSANWNEEEILQELNDCLPSWVTRDQKLELISSHGGDIVQVVSNFYEHETDFHRRAFASTASTSGSQTDLTDVSTPLILSPRPVKTVTIKDYNLKSPMKLSKSPITGKQKKSNNKSKSKSKSIVDKPKKRQKIDMKKEVTGPKQARITNFFTKVTASGGGESVDGSSHCSKDETLLSGSFNEAVEQFTQITKGDELSRSYAANILEKTKGDINMALDIYYRNNSEATPDTVDSLATQGLSSIEDKLSPQQDKIRSKDLEIGVANTFEDESVKSGKINVSLPPDKYNPAEHACWSCGQPVPYIHLARTFDLVEREKGRIKATSMLCNMFRSLLALSPEDVLSAVYLCTNKIAADHEKMELNIGMSLVTSAMEEACGVKRSKIKDMYDKLGDLGDVAQECRQTQSLLRPPSPLLVKDVISELRKICVQTGTGSNARKKGIIVKLMRSCREMEIKFLVRTLVRNLRIGAMMKTVLPAFAQAVAINSVSNWQNEDATAKMEKVQSLSAAVAEAYNVLPSLDLVIPTVMKEGIEFSASTLSMTPGIPIKPMLAKITNGVPTVVKLFQNRAFTCEFKYDGQRAQIHRSMDGSIRVFSRNGDETTSRFPDVVASIKEACKPSTSSFVLDAEVVAVDRKNGCKIMSFQELSSRERGSRDSFVPINNIKVDICIFVFDIMFANGKQLLSTPLRERRKYMKELFNDVKKGYFENATEITIEAEDSDMNSEATVTKINSFLEDALRSSCEGVMVKSLDVDAGYSPSKRSDTWLKVKRDYVEGLSDSLDLVPIGAWHGNGRKAGWYSPFLMACYDPDTEEYQSVCRVMSGFSDAFYIEMKEFFTEDRVLSKKPPYYKTAEVPDMWFSAEVVWEIRGADFTVSPVHQAAVGLVHPSKGISMRFPRFIRRRVDDRSPEECSTAADVAELFQLQSRKMDVNSGKN